MRELRVMKASTPASVACGLTLASFLAAFPTLAQTQPEASEAQELQPASLVACPYTPSEIQDAFGVPVDKGQASDMTYPEGRDVGCLYDVQTSSAVITVRQTWGTPRLPTGAPSQTAERFTRPVRDDVDGAEWVREKGDADGNDDKKVKLSYKRANARVVTEISYYGGGQFLAADIRPKLLKLRRVP